MKKTTAKKAYINFINSSIISPKNFESLEDFIFYCNICAVIYYDFLDIELTKFLCENKWVTFFKNQKLLLPCTQN